MFRFIRRYLGRLKGNARVCICFHPLWGIPFTFYYYYLSMYLKEMGVSDTGLGQIMLAGTAASFVFSIVSAPLVDRMGRRRSTLVFDLLSSALPPLIYFLSGSFLAALLGTILYNANKIMSIGYYLVMIEDADDEQRVVAFNLFNIITVVAGLLLPLAGLAVDRYGVVATERVFLLVSFLCMTAMILLRHRLLRETRLGAQLLQKRREEGGGPFWRELLAPYRGALGYLMRSRAARCMALANLFFYVYMTIGSNQSLYFLPYFADFLRMDTMQSAALGFVYYGGMLGAMLLINPLLGRAGLFGGITASSVLSLAGLIALVLLPAGNFPLTVAAVLVMSVGYGMLKTGVDGGLAVYSESEARSGVYSLTNLLSSALGIVATAACTALYTRFAGWVYLICALMVAAILLCALAAGREARRSDG